MKIVKLRHPHTGTGSLFAFSHKDSKVFEVNIFEDGRRLLISICLIFYSFDLSYRSWFVDDSVVSDGSLLLTTQVDPLFIVIPYLRKVKSY